ncbi:MAG: sigma-54 dependent transcriptional regulator [Acidobacteriia bacterium]|nr:sigma-54 dependent transcriptional regulator [Terriglobia bacterium]
MYENKENDAARTYLFNAHERGHGKDKTANESRILLIDDDPGILESLTEYLTERGYEVQQASSLRAAYRVLEEDLPDIAILDYRLPDGDALEFLAKLKSMNVHTETIVLTGHGSIDLAVKAIKEGAYQFLTKPVQYAVLDSMIKACLETQQIRRKQLAGSVRLTRRWKNPFEGVSAAIRNLEAEVQKILQTGRPILIQGETGTGKGVLADWIHKSGSRSEEPFVDVNCAGLSSELMESELFGHEKGAFTGAVSVKQGLIELAHRGILFLDEVSEMAMMVQAKLLKVLEEKRFRRLGDVRQRTADVQIIAATNRDIQKAVRELLFREDLYYRLATFHVRIPPLRERPEDIPFLAETILADLAKDLAREQKALSQDAIDAFQRHSWPGNIRELRNVLERVALTCETRIIGPKALGLPGANPGESLSAVGGANWPIGLTLSELEKQHILRVLEEEQGKVAQAAARLGIPRSSLYQKLKLFGLGPPGEG